MSLNPVLEQTRFCPRCGAPGPRIDFPRSMTCEACGFASYSNPKPVASAIPRDPHTGALILLRRGFDPGRGLWTFPGGFVDLGESVEDAARREIREELEIDVELRGVIGVYSRPQDRVVLVVFDALALGAPNTTPEAPEVRAFAAADLPWDELAFWSTECALRDALSSAR
ncbi:MAG TPA: NUDIX domain-containing protein [Solirubrobacteraceae bacterium]|nr:NUDIX domain-containing protein [Solirubrobacteraceae bacterium]